MQLRLIELLVFAEFFLAIEGAEWFDLQRSAGIGDFKIVVVVRFFAMFSMLILAYGMLMPNTWQRAAAILFPVACIPFAAILIMSSQGVALSLSFEPFPFMAAVLAVFGTHVINSSRKAAFKARQFGQYRLKEKLGAGGMGEVYRAEHMLLKRPCVIKLIKKDRSTNAAALARFEREVCSTAKLTHSNSVEIFDYGHTEDGVFYYVMEYLPGKSLDELVRASRPFLTTDLRSTTRGTSSWSDSPRLEAGKHLCCQAGRRVRCHQTARLRACQTGRFRSKERRRFVPDWRLQRIAALHAARAGDLLR